MHTAIPNPNPNPNPNQERSGVMLVHTAVGPRDLMLQWRAQRLALTLT